jgi:lipopolysaccharide transport system ATP-binding protein
LEVGTGFHPELTGKENIFLNGAILGMGKAEISRKFDEIVAFAGVERFLGTPVKHYSSGMYVRLAFAVAAHLEPEILIVDEVLAVGDAQFQKKCLGKLEEAGEEGKTVLFVSHQMAAVEKLCRKGILLNQGKIQYIGSQTKAIAKYLTTDTDNTVSLESREDRIGSGEVRVFSIDVKDNEGNLLDVSQSGQDISINLHFKKISSFRSEHLIASISVKNQLEVPVFLQHNRLTGDAFGQLPATGVLVCQINNLPLPPSSYRISYSLIQDGAYLDSLSDATDLTVVDGDFYGSGEVPPVTHGVCLIDASWHIKS